MLSKLLALEPGQLSKLAPFFVVYFFLFTALTIADGVSISLFASQIGADHLPKWYMVTALFSLTLIGGYLLVATRFSGATMFGFILATIGILMGAGWLAARWLGGTSPLGMIFVTREVALTVVLMHFGTFLQDYFTRNEMNRILPIIYAGGRVGGIVGGGILADGARLIGTLNLISVVIFFLAFGWGMIRWIVRNMPLAADEEDVSATSFHRPLYANHDSNVPSLSIFARMKSFAGWLKTNSLLQWLTLTTLGFIVCRWILAYQYTHSFEHAFPDDVELSAFMGRYTQVALVFSLLLQVFFVNRIVLWLGVAGAHHLYCGLVMGGLIGNAVSAGLLVACVSRFVESELRFGLRNPVNQMMVNRFTKKERILVRGWSLGLLIPIGTLFSSGLIGIVVYYFGIPGLIVTGIFFGTAYLAISIGLGRSYHATFTGSSKRMKDEPFVEQKV